MIKALIFDCFGLLYPDISLEFFEKHKDRFGGDHKVFDRLNFQIDFGEITQAEFFAGLEKESGLPIELIKKEWNREIVVNDKIVEFIKKFRGKYKIGLLSNAGKEEIEIIYRDKIDNLFDATTISYEVRIVKPDKEIFFMSAKRLNVEPSECVFIDDRMSNIEAAEKIGMKGVLYTDLDTLEKNFESYL